MAVFRVVSCIFLFVSFSFGAKELPELPTSFILKYSDYTPTDHKLSYNEVYFDHEHRIAKISSSIGPKRTTFIADYAKDRVIEYSEELKGGLIGDYVYQQESCKVGPFKDYPQVENWFGKKGEETELNSYDFFRFGENYGFILEGNECLKDRGINATSYFAEYSEKELKGEYVMAKMHWSGIENNFVFANYIKEAPISLEIIDNSNTPVKYTQYMSLAPNASENITFPEDTFVIPENIHCDAYGSKDPLPTIEPIFQMVVEKSYSNSDGLFRGPFYQKIWYDSISQLVQIDFIPKENPELLNKTDATFWTGIWDANSESKVVYFINQETGDCIIESINPSTEIPFIDSKGSVITTQSYFFPRDNFEKKDTHSCNGMMCTVWSSFDKQSTLEVYVNDEAETGVQKPMILVEKVDTLNVVEKYQTNYFGFRPNFDGTPSFDLRNCMFKSLKHRHYTFQFSYDGIKDLYQNSYKNFMEKVKIQIHAKAVMITPLNLQDLNLKVSQDKINVFFTLFENSRNTKKTLDEMEKGLKDAINGNSLAIDINDGTKVIKLTASSFGRLMPQEEPIEESTTAKIVTENKESTTAKIVTENKESTTAKIVTENKESTTAKIVTEDIEPTTAKIVTKNKESTTVKITTEAAKITDKDEIPEVGKAVPTKETKYEGYTPGAVTGMAFGMLFLGILLGIGCTYIYIVKFLNKRSDSMEMNRRK